MRPTYYTRGFASKWFQGLRKTSSSLMGKMGNLLKGQSLDKVGLQNMEEALLTADVGLPTTQHLIQRVKDRTLSGENNESVGNVLRSEMLSVLNNTQPDLRLKSRRAPTVLLLAGANGTGKTTTAGKLCHLYRTKYNRRPILSAADTFRAAAVEQLEQWAHRANVEICVSTPKGGGNIEGNVAPEQAVYEAITKAKNQGNDLVVVDTAGRLQNNRVLMREMQDIYMMAGRARKGAPDHVWTVIDATTGQNAVEQARSFQTHIRSNGLVVTKMDGSAKGGVVLAIAHELRIPVCYVGLGEQLDDLQPFNAEEYVDAILNLEQYENQS